jgi:acetate kinase
MGDPIGPRLLTVRIGEKAALIRAGVCRDTGRLGVGLDAEANLRGGPRPHA